MSTVFNENALLKIADKLSATYQQATPVPHIYIDNIFNPEVLNKALEAFPTPENFEFYKYDNPLEKKLAFDQIAKLPSEIAKVLHAMNSLAFLNFLEKLSGIEGLIPDPYYRGGGIHQIPQGGKLDIHVDFNKHPKLKLDRRLNVLIYLNKNWEESYGGHFEIWNGHKEGDTHVLDSCQTQILPVFNRLAMFSTSERSYHGHPDPITCPDGWTRKSLATYYYTVGHPEYNDTEAHSTTFIKRPNEPENAELDELRERRNKKRLNSNIKTKLK